MTNIDVVFRDDGGFLCGLMCIKLHSSITRYRIVDMIDYLQTNLEEPYKQTGKIFYIEDVTRHLQEMFGEGANITLDLNIVTYGTDEIERDILYDSSSQNLAVFINDYTQTILLQQEGSSVVIEDMLRQNGIIII